MNSCGVAILDVLQDDGGGPDRTKLSWGSIVMIVETDRQLICLKLTAYKICFPDHSSIVRQS